MAQQWPKVEFSVLGPLEVTAAGQPLPLGGPKQRLLLARLLSSANEVVSRATLIDDLWGEQPPTEAEATLRVYVARLRKILATGNGSAPTLETRGDGYVLRLEPGALDAHRFERLVAAGRQALTEGRVVDASRSLADALELWRGPALVDLADDEWARRESARLGELRLAALEERIEADLRLGRHAELVPELEAIVAREPHRERLVAQLMLALYRCGRQPDALDVYARTRDTLRDRFGLEPTRALRDLERSILVQDATLDVEPAATEGAERAPRRRRRGAVAAAVAVVVLAVGAVAATAFRDPAASPVALEGNSVVVIDPETNVAVGEVSLGGRPSGIAVGLGSVWVGNADAKTLLRIDPQTREVVETIGLGVEPTTVVVGGGSVWVLSRVASAVLEIDPVSNGVVDTIEFPRSDRVAQIAFGRGVIWVLAYPPPPGVLFRIDPKARSVDVHLRNVSAITLGGGAVWGVVGWERDRVRRIDPPGETIRFDRFGSILGLGGILGGDDEVWTGTDDTLWRIDPGVNRVTASIPVRRPVSSAALGERAIWIFTRDGAVLRVDPAGGRVTEAISLGLYAPSVPNTIAVGEGAVWVAALER